MATSIKAFKIELYQEHLEEASFLYQQRLSLLHNPAISWRDVGEFEERLEAHIDALVVGEELALEICKKQALDGDFGELFAAVCVFCRQMQANLLAEVFRTLDYQDKEKLRAVVDAVKYEFPAPWNDYCAKALSGSSPSLLPILATLCGYKRLPLGEHLHRLMLATSSSKTDVNLIWAIGRLKFESSHQTLQPFLRHEDEALCSAALISLLHLGDYRALESCYLLVQTKSWPYIAFGLGGSRSASNILRDAISYGRADPDCLLALGLLGDLAALKSIHTCLDQPNLAESAALALNLITGADLYEEAFIPEPIDEDELFEHELKAYREENKVPTRADGQPFGTTVVRLSEDPERWKSWFSENASRFQPEKRYRNGKLYSPVCLLENLASEKTPYRLRELAYEELVIRYNADFSFEVDMPVHSQLAAINKLSAWVNENNIRFQAGCWYFACRLVQ